MFGKLQFPWMSTAWQRISRPSGKEINKLQKPGISQFLGNEREWQARLFALFFFPTPFPGNRLNRLLKVRNLTILSNASIAQQHPSGAAPYFLIQKSLYVPFLRTKDMWRLSHTDVVRKGEALPLWLRLISGLVANPCLHQRWALSTPLCIWQLQETPGRESNLGLQVSYTVSC